jgi:hypothetical protein
MTRRSRLLVLGAALVIAAAAACASDAPTTPPANTMAPDAGALLDGSLDSTCRGGWGTPNGKTC